MTTEARVGADLVVGHSFQAKESQVFNRRTYACRGRPQPQRGPRAAWLWLLTSASVLSNQGRQRGPAPTDGSVLGLYELRQNASRLCSIAIGEQRVRPYTSCSVRCFLRAQA